MYTYTHIHKYAKYIPITQLLGPVIVRLSDLVVSNIYINRYIYINTRTSICSIHTCLARWLSASTILS